VAVQGRHLQEQEYYQTGHKYRRTVSAFDWGNYLEHVAFLVPVQETHQTYPQSLDPMKEPHVHLPYLTANQEMMDCP